MPEICEILYVVNVTRASDTQLEICVFANTQHFNLQVSTTSANNITKSLKQIQEYVELTHYQKRVLRLLLREYAMGKTWDISFPLEIKEDEYTKKTIRELTSNEVIIDF